MKQFAYTNSKGKVETIAAVSIEAARRKLYEKGIQYKFESLGELVELCRVL